MSILLGAFFIAIFQKGGLICVRFLKPVLAEGGDPIISELSVKQ